MTDKIWERERVIAFTADVDWASEDALQYAHHFFETYDIPITYFLTHPSPFLTELSDAGRIDAGIHPNFLAGSSHGNSIPEVMDYCMKLVPHLECFRSHRYFDVTDVTHGFYQRGLRYDCNVCTLLEKGLRPFKHESGLIRFPTYFEDGTYLFHGRNLNFGEVGDDLFSSPGLMVLSFHPMHMVMNSPSLPYSRQVKDSLSREEWNNMAGVTLEKSRYSGRGIRDFVMDMLGYIRRHELRVYSLRQLYDLYRDERAGDHK